MPVPCDRSEDTTAEPTPQQGTALNEAFVKCGSHEPIYPTPCTGLISVTGATPIMAGSGTGAYLGMRAAACRSPSR